MAELVANGTDGRNRWRRTLPPGEPVVLGRSAPWAVPWDEHISRRHAELCWRDGRLEVRQLPSARNPVYVDGTPTPQAEISPGQHFVIGTTTFLLTDEEVHVSLDLPRPAEEQTFSAEYLQRIRFHNADHRIEVLSRMPEVISGATSDAELYIRLMSMLLAGMPRAEAVALVAVDRLAQPKPAVRVLAWDRRRATREEFRPSERLILEATDRRQSVLHVWRGGGAAEPQPFTMIAGFEWAFCTPVLGDFCRGWGIYVAGRFTSDSPASPTPTDPSDLRDDLKFAELVGATLSSLRQVQTLRDQNAVLRQFFSPVVLHALAADETHDALAPRETDVSVLFCDLRGFSRKAERDARDLLGLLERVSRALGVMTRHIREQGGVVGDYHGDAAMGFWGWPLAQPDAVRKACMAALAIRAEFESAAGRADDPLADFRVGIGIASGRAVAGKIGTDDQVKVTVFGPVVNLASRLEGMTKILRAPILVDSVTARYVKRELAPREARCRRLAIVRPYGLEAALEVSELLPNEAEFPTLRDEHIVCFESAVEAFLRSDWQEAFELLHRVPPEDRVKDFLTVFIAQHNRTPPTNWNGVIPLASKS